MGGFTGHWRRWQCYYTLLTGTEMASLSAHTGSDADSGSRSQPPQAECTSSCSEGRLAKPKRCAMERAARPQPHVCHKAKENQRRPTCYDFQSFSLLSEGSLSWLLKHWLLSWLLKHCPREGNGSKNNKNKCRTDTNLSV